MVAGSTASPPADKATVVFPIVDRPGPELVREHDAQLIAADADAGDLPNRLTLEHLRQIEWRRQFLGPARRGRRGPSGDPGLSSRRSRGAGRRDGESQHSDRKACR